MSDDLIHVINVEEVIGECMSWNSEKDRPGKVKLVLCI